LTAVTISSLAANLQKSGIASAAGLFSPIGVAIAGHAG